MAEIQRANGWLVPSQSDPKIRYLVHEDGGRWKCDCRDFEFRGSQRDCKHIKAVKQALGMPLGVPPKKMHSDIERMYGGFGGN